MSCAKKITLIETTLSKRGDGKTHPIRFIKELWTEDGKLVASIDPCAETIGPEVLAGIQELYFALHGKNEETKNNWEKLGAMIMGPNWKVEEKYCCAFKAAS